MKSKSVEDLQKQLAEFAKERDWNKFHSPKNLVMALSGEAGELIEIFQWLTESESENLNSKQLKHVEEEVADVLLYLLRLADKLGIDVLESAYHKLEVNNEKYPIASCYGTAKKYTEL